MFQLRLLRDFLSNRKAATAIEYGLIAALVAIAIIVSLVLFGDEMSKMFNTISAAVSSVTS